MKKAFLIFLISFCLFGCNSKTKSELPYIAYDRAVVQEYDIEKIFQGYLKGKYDVDLSFNLSGIIQKKYVTDGSNVKKGQLLARLDSDEYILDIEKAKGELNDTYIIYNRAKSYFERISKLYKAGGISYNDWENAETDLKSASNKIKILNDNLKLAQNKEKFTKILAPSDGIIIKAIKDEGEYVSAGENVFIFQGNGVMEAKIFVPQTEINNLKIGEKVIIRADFIKKEFTGKIYSKVNSTRDTGGAYTVTISIDEKDPSLLDGMTISAVIKKGSLNGIFIPKSVVSADNEGAYVYVLKKDTNNEGRAVKRRIKTGETVQDMVYIKCGLAEGEFYITEGADKIMEGAKVKFDD